MKTLILAGGSGKRLWPLSRSNVPKQFIKILEGRSLMEKTIERALLHSKPNDIFIGASVRLKQLIRNHLDDIAAKIPDKNIFLEPASKNTLPAIYWGIKRISQKGRCKVLVLPSDHLIPPDESYCDSVKKAKRLADDYLVAFGVKPWGPNTGYGYIKPGKRIKGGFEVESFMEKPNLKNAKDYFRRGYLWNSGMFCFDSEIFTDSVRKLAPDVAKAFESDDIHAFNLVKSVSIDCGIMEKAKNAALTLLKTSWSDMGSFESIYDISQKDENENAFLGDCLSVESRNNLVIGKRLTALAGVKNHIIVDTDDALLISKRGQSQNIARICKMLEDAKDTRAEDAQTVHRPWGYYRFLARGDGYNMKEITVLPGKRLSLQRHKRRAEHWIVVEGRAKVTLKSKKISLEPQQTIFIPRGDIHRLENEKTKKLRLIELQLGDYFGEDDIERLEDDYDRK